MPRTCLLAIGAVALAVGCHTKSDVARAKRSVYDAEFAIVYNAALEATRELYPEVNDNPKTGALSTQWRPVSYANNQDDLSANGALSKGSTGGNLATSPAAAQAGMPTRVANKRHYIRFDVVVAGGRPWHVKVVGHASEWDPGAALPVELVGAAKPPWLEGRTDALTLAIYNKMKPYAVPMKQELAPAKPEDLIPKSDPKAFGNVPPEAGKRMAQLTDAIVRREYPALRAQLFDDVAWSLGGAASADTALAMWQADPAALDAMAKALAGTCASTDKRVTCPGGDPVAGQFQLVLELRGDVWKVSSFVKAE